MQRSRKRRRRHSRRIDFRRFAMFIFFLAIGIFALVRLVDYGVDSVRRKQENARLAQEYTDAFAGDEADSGQEEQSQPVSTPQPVLLDSYRSLKGEVSQRAKNLYKQNNDLVGWLYINGIVDLPVVYRDNEYYLTHNFNGKKDSGGALFLDEYHPLTEQTQNLVVHGHNMHDGSMFGILRSYDKLDVVKSHAFARFSTLFAPEDYVIFAVLRVVPDQYNSDYFAYIGKPRFGSTDEFYNYTNELKQRSMFGIPVDVRPSDGLLTLATCIGDDRLVVAFRRVRDGESRESLQTCVDLAYGK